METYNKQDIERLKRMKKDTDMAYQGVMRTLEPRRTGRYITACLISAGIAVGTYAYLKKPATYQVKGQVNHRISVLEKNLSDLTEKYNKIIDDANPHASRLDEQRQQTLSNQYNIVQSF